MTKRELFNRVVGLKNRPMTPETFAELGLDPVKDVAQVTELMVEMACAAIAKFHPEEPMYEQGIVHLGTLVFAFLSMGGRLTASLNQGDEN